MTRIFSVLLAIVLSFVLAFPAFGEGTTQRTIMEFMDLYTRRIIDFSEEMHVPEDRGVPVYHPYTHDGKTMLTVNKHSIEIDPATYEIKSLFMGFSPDSQTIMAMAATIAALEYSYAEEEENRTAYFHGVEGFTDNITKACYDRLRNAYSDAIESGSLSGNKKVLLWSGNYDYYLQHSVIEELDYDGTVLFAESRLEE